MTFLVNLPSYATLVASLIIGEITQPFAYAFASLRSAWTALDGSWGLLATAIVFEDLVNIPFSLSPLTFLSQQKTI